MKRLTTHQEQPTKLTMIAPIRTYIDPKMIKEVKVYPAAIAEGALIPNDEVLV